MNGRHLKEVGSRRRGEKTNEACLVYTFQSEFIYRAVFAEPLFELLDSHSRIFRLVYSVCTPFGASAQDITYEGNLREPASATITGKCRTASVSLKVQLTNLQVHWTYSPGEYIAPAQTVAEKTIELLGEAGFSVLPLGTHLITWAGHLKLSDITPSEYLSRFVSGVPIELGATEPVGVGFSKEATDERLACAINFQPSIAVEDGIYSRFDLQWSGQLGISDVVEKTRTEVWKTLKSCGLIEK